MRRISARIFVALFLVAFACVSAAVAGRAGAPDGLAVAATSGLSLTARVARVAGRATRDDGDTRVYAIEIHGTPGSAVGLRTAGLPPGWVASFCVPHECSPFQFSVTLPAGGATKLQFHVVPKPAETRRSVPVRIDLTSAADHVTLQLMSTFLD